MVTNTIKLFGAVVLIAAGAGFAYQATQDKGPGFEVVSAETKDKLEVIQFDFFGEPFKFEVADDLPAIKQGLSGRAEIPTGTGMLFIDDGARIQSYWMADCVIDMDIAFVAPSGKVTAIHTMKMDAPRGENEPVPVYHARLKRYSSNLPAKYAIETPAGTNERLGVKPGKKIEIDWKAIDKLLD
ncbi:MAG: DUF192 domain-containing protein [Planctomycetota bacterium]|nr:DUF192 domain-containing protein [Planctomycetota bacterium]MDA1106568.1 DUF192 domain-containing protein [Planctomycetota bacterium]